jgi:Domain of unknown function (DUF4345)
MNLFQILNYAGAIITITFGILGLCFPNKASKLTGLMPTNKASFAEFRGTLGGSFLVMGIMPIVTAHPMAYLITGLFWMGAAFGRIVSIILDNGFKEQKNNVSVFGEAFFGLLLLIGNPYLNNLL